MPPSRGPKTDPSHPSASCGAIGFARCDAIISMPMTSVEQLASVGASYCERRAGLRAMLLAAVGTLGIVRRTAFSAQLVPFGATRFVGAASFFGAAYQLPVVASRPGNGTDLTPTCQKTKGPSFPEDHRVGRVVRPRIRVELLVFEGILGGVDPGELRTGISPTIPRIASRTCLRSSRPFLSSERWSALLRRFLAARHEIENPNSLSNNYL